jgi:hypothetical protein
MGRGSAVRVRVALPDNAEKLATEFVLKTLKKFPTSNAPSWTSVTGTGPPNENRVIRTCGRFALIRMAGGFRWTLTTAGGIWHWHAEAHEWSACRTVLHRSVEEATAGLDELLAHEEAGDLDEQHGAPTLRATVPESASTAVT